MNFKFESIKDLGDFSFNVSEIHGIITGALCSTNSVEKALQAVDGVNNEVVNNVSQMTLSQLQDDNFTFQLLLPSDDMPLTFRTESMALWAQGFLSGLAEGALNIEKSTQSELREMFYDVLAISHADTEVEDNDEGEQYYTEITEYLRIIAMRFYLEFTVNLPLTLSQTEREQKN